MKRLFAMTLLVLFVFIVGPVALGIQAHCFNAFDLGIYARALSAITWSDLNPWISVRGVRIFFDHFDPVLIPAAFFTRVVAPSYLMAGLEWVAVALATLSFIYAYDRKLLTFNWACFGILCLLLSQGSAMAFHYPGHPSTWSLATLAWACVLLRRQRFETSLFLFFLCCLFKEEYALYLFFISGFLAFKYPKQRFLSGAYFVVSCLWLIGVFYVRPKFADVYVGYEHAFGEGLSQTTKLANFYSNWNNWKTLLLIALPIVPLLFLRVKLTYERRLLTFLLLMMIGVRIFGLWWFPHRSVQLIVVALWAFLPQMERTYYPQKYYRLVSTLAWLCFFGSAQPHLKYVRTLWGEPYKKSCPREEGRLASIDVAFQRLREDPMPVAAVQSNLVPGLADRDNVVLLEGNFLEKVHYILLEKPPYGDVWPQTEEANQILQVQLLQSGDWTPVINDPHILLLARK